MRYPMEDLIGKLDLTNIPKHVAIIMDGNGRWAKQQGQDRLYGHVNGVESVRATLKAAQETGVKYLTLYTFSTENWNRPKDEVEGLMDLLVNSIANEVEELNESGVRLMAIGDISGLPQHCEKSLREAIAKTAQNSTINLVLALNYSSKWELKNAIRKIALDVKENQLQLDEISDDLISKYLETKDIPDPELMIRTSGEHRISNFLLWQLAYAEFFFTETHWPDFRREDFIKAILAYQNRERRFGMVSEQIKN